MIAKNLIKVSNCVVVAPDSIFKINNLGFIIFKDHFILITQRKMAFNY